MLDTLPDELIWKIIYFMPARSWPELALTSKRYLDIYYRRPNGKFVLNIDTLDALNAYFNDKVIFNESLIVGLKITSCDISSFDYTENGTRNNGDVKFLLFDRVEYSIGSLNRILKLFPNVHPQEVYLHACTRVEKDCHLPNVNDSAQITEECSRQIKDCACSPANDTNEKCDRNKVDNEIVASLVEYACEDAKSKESWRERYYMRLLAGHHLMNFVKHEERSPSVLTH